MNKMIDRQKDEKKTKVKEIRNKIVGWSFWAGLGESKKRNKRTITTCKSDKKKTRKTKQTPGVDVMYIELDSTIIYFLLHCNF